ncbi:MAG: hypothetical protein WAL50_18250 [Kineosporiaceae bacterium]
MGARVATSVGRATLGLALGAKLTTERKLRATFAPWWIAFAVIVSSIWQFQSAIWWAAVAAIARVSADRWAGPGHGMSTVEWHLLSLAASCGGAWCLARPYVPWSWALLTLAIGTVGIGMPWWQGRRVRTPDHEPEPVGPPKFVVAWYERIVPAVPALDGAWLEWDQEEGAGAIELDKAHADDAVKLVGDAEAALNAVPGTIRFWRDRGDKARVLRVALVRDIVKREDEVQYWTGPTLTDDGKVHGGDTMDGRRGVVSKWRDGGAAFGAVLGGPGSGKGGASRCLILESCLSPRVFTIVIDGKMGGQGLPEVRDGVDIYALGDDAANVIALVYKIMQVRAYRYGASGESRWTPLRDPLIELWIDEFPIVTRTAGSVAMTQLEEIIAAGRSAGVSVWVLSQRGDVQSLGNRPTIRANLFGAGTVLAGMTGDRNTNSHAVQDWADLGVSAADLPKVAGHMLILSKIDPQPPTAVRFRYLPSRAEVQEEGKEAPYGVAEDWFAKAVQAPLHPEDAAIVDELMEPATPTPTATLTREPPAGGTDEADSAWHAPLPPSPEAANIPDGEPDWAAQWGVSDGVSPGVSEPADTPPPAGTTRARVGDTPPPRHPDTPPTLPDRVHAYLVDRGPTRRGDIAKALGALPANVSRALRRLNRAARAVKNAETDEWSAL